MKVECVCCTLYGHHQPDKTNMLFQNKKGFEQDSLQTILCEKMYTG